MTTTDSPKEASKEASRDAALRFGQESGDAEVISASPAER